MVFEFTVRQRLAALTLFFFLLLGGSLLFFNRDNQGYTEEYRARKDDEEIYVHVCGAVVRPGVIKVKPGTRKFEVIRQAGGVLPEGDLDQVNLAEYVLDGEQVYLPTKGEVIVKTNRPKTIAAAMGPNTEIKEKTANTAKGPYDLNSATQKELESVPGIGPALAGRIIQYRTEHGKFNRYEDLLNVPGIGAAKMRQFRAHLFVE
ncbi:MAG: helix-hairpin-helix domain-containing protein [Bacteroidota bacterium]